MKVVLLDNVKKIGKKGDIVEVAEGLALNKLIPQKNAVAATPQVLIQLEKNRTAQEGIQGKVGVAQEKITFILRNTPSIILQKRADSGGHLFEKVHTKEIVNLIQELLPADIKSTIYNGDFKIPTIKATGIYTVMYVPTNIYFAIEIKPLS